MDNGALWVIQYTISMHNKYSVPGNHRNGLTDFWIRSQQWVDAVAEATPCRGCAPSRLTSGDRSQGDVLSVRRHTQTPKLRSENHHESPSKHQELSTPLFITTTTFRSPRQPVTMPHRTRTHSVPKDLHHHQHNITRSPGLDLRPLASPPIPPRWSPCPSGVTLVQESATRGGRQITKHAACKESRKVLDNKAFFDNKCSVLFFSSYGVNIS